MARRNMQRRLIYVPLDVALDSLRVRILRAIRHFEWASVADIAHGAGCPDYQSRNATGSRAAINHEAYALNRNLCRLVADGYIERRGVNAGSPDNRYRITPRGTRELARLLRRGIPRWTKLSSRAA